MNEVNDLMHTTCDETNYLKRLVQSCERDMEDFSAAMDAVNVDLDEMRSKVDSTHSIMFSRQRIEASVTADISSLRLDLVDFHETLKTHDTWMKDITASMQEAHQRIEGVQQEALELHRQELSTLDSKVDHTQWNENNEEIDASVKMVRDMLSSLREEVSENRQSCCERIEAMLKKIIDSHQTAAADNESINAAVSRAREFMNSRLDTLSNNIEEAHVWQNKTWQMIDDIGSNSAKECGKISDKIRAIEQNGEQSLRRKSKELLDLVDDCANKGVTASNEATKKINSLDFRLDALQGTSIEAKRDLSKAREEASEFKVRIELLNAEMTKTQEEIKSLEHERCGDQKKLREDVDAIIEELEIRGVDKAQRALEAHVAKLSKGLVKLAQILGVFPGTRIEEGTNEVLELDVEMLNWEDICENMVSRVEKTWQHVSSQKFRSVLDLVSKKADNSLLRLLQISQQHIETQLERLRDERELWKDAIDKRQHQPGQQAVKILQTDPPVVSPEGHTGANPTKTVPTKTCQPPSQLYLEVVKVNASPLGKRVKSKSRAPRA